MVDTKSPHTAHTGRAAKVVASVNGSSSNGPGPAESAAIPVSRARVRACLISAILWADELPRYANYQQSKADWWALAAGVVATVTGLAVFPILSDQSNDRDKFIVAFFALVAGICALVPRIKNYAEMAGKGRELASAFGPLEGRLLDAFLQPPETVDPEEVHSAVADFEAAKAKKDQLRYLPRGKRLARAEAGAQRQFKELTAPTVP